MKRRRALGLIGLAAAGTVVFSSCEFISIPELKNLSLDKSQYKKLKELSNKILPIPKEMILDNLEPADFTLIMMDDCEKTQDIDKFTAEMAAFLNEHQNIGKMDMSTLSTEIENSFFLQKVREYNISYYKGLEEYLTSYTDYEFIPGRFLGCVKV